MNLKLRLSLAFVSTLAVAAAVVVLTRGASYAAAGDKDAVVATIGDHKIMAQEVDDKLKAQLAQMQVQLYDLKHNAIEALADDYLIEQAAKKADLSTAAYLKREIDDKVAEPSDAETRKLYDQYKSRIPRPYDQVKSRLAGMIKGQKVSERREQLLSELRKDEGLKILLKPPRFHVAVGDNPAIGPKDAPVAVAEFTDFQCPYCKRAEPTVKQIRDKYGDKVRIVHVDFPLGMHNNAMNAAEAARCAEEQNKFWQYHDALFTDQGKLAPSDLKATAVKLGLDATKFNACFDSSKYAKKIAEDQALGKSLGVDGTPAFFVNGRMLTGAQPLQAFQEVIDEELAGRGAKQEARR
ncbi:MAG: thioredoxin domain-containing protein [Candidatus Binataceae bacterium]